LKTPLIALVLVVILVGRTTAADPSAEARAARHRDPEIRRFAESLSPADALNIYAEALDALGRLYPDSIASDPAALYVHGVDEFDRALTDGAFRAAYCPDATGASLTAFQHTLRTDWKARVPVTVREARQLAYAVTAAARKALGFRTPAAVALEFLRGACLGLDDYTHFLAAPTLEGASLTTVADALMLAECDGVGYVRLTRFGPDTPRDLDAAVGRLRMAGLRVLILDLRGNPGGLLRAAVEIARRFQPGGVVATARGRVPEFAGRVFSADAGAPHAGLPLVLLIDGGTMSAAEVVAAAWRDQRRATLVGAPTYGKGAVQSGPQPLQKGVLIVTLAHLFGPLGAPIEGAGVVPHYTATDPAAQLDLAVTKALELIDP
jgi:hypothetical protein